MSRRRDGFSCEDCNLPDNVDDMVRCDFCGRWIHYKCAGVDELVKNIEWICSRCEVRTAAPSSRNPVNDVQKKVTKHFCQKSEKIAEKKPEKNVGQKPQNNVGKKQENTAGKTVENLQLDVASITLGRSKNTKKQISKQTAAAPVLNTFHEMSKYLPCTELVALDTLKSSMSCESTVNTFVAYLKSFFGMDLKSSIKKSLDIVMDKQVQKQLSWSDRKTKKPSFQTEYKPIVDAMHFALQSHFSDYNYSVFALKMQALLQGAK